MYLRSKMKWNVNNRKLVGKLTGVKLIFIIGLNPL